MIDDTDYAEQFKGEIESAGSMIGRIADSTVGRILGHSNAETIFGPAETQGERTVIPVGRVSTRYGFGGGSGHGTAEGSESEGGGGGGGGGGQIEVKPVGYIELTPETSRFVPIVDQSAIAIRAVTIWGIVGLFFVLGLFRAVRGRR